MNIPNSKLKLIQIKLLLGRVFLIDIYLRTKVLYFQLQGPRVSRHSLREGISILIWSKNLRGQPVAFRDVCRIRLHAVSRTLILNGTYRTCNDAHWDLVVKS